MKINRLHSGNYDPSTRILTIDGTNSIGKASRVSIALEDADLFLGWMASVLQEKSTTEGGKALVAESVNFSLHEDASGGHDLVFRFVAGQVRMAFALPVHTRAAEKLAAIKAHLEQALAEFSDTRFPTTH